MAQISSQLAYVSASQQIRHARELSDLYIRPPVSGYSIFDTPKLKEIRRIGYEQTMRELGDWSAARDTYINK